VIGFKLLWGDNRFQNREMAKFRTSSHPWICIYVIVLLVLCIGGALWYFKANITNPTSSFRLRRPLRAFVSDDHPKQQDTTTQDTDTTTDDYDYEGEYDGDYKEEAEVDDAETETSPPPFSNSFSPSDLYTKLLDYTPALDRISITKGLKSQGDPSKMRTFLTKLQNGEPVTIAAVGGSITTGQGATTNDGVIQGYVQMYFKYINDTWPHNDHVLINTAFGGTTSSIYTMCLEAMVGDADMVIVEFSVNDSEETPLKKGQIDEDDPSQGSQLKNFERLLRKLMTLPSQPAVVLMHYYSWFLSMPERDNRGDYYWPVQPNIITHDPDQWTNDRGMYYASIENEYTTIGEYYGLPQLSIRAACYHQMVAGKPGFQTHVWRADHEEVTNEDDLFYYDAIHPQTKTGYKMMTDLLVAGLLQQTAIDLMLHPGSNGSIDSDDGSFTIIINNNNSTDPLSSTTIPRPMFYNNWQRNTTTCRLGRDIQGAAVSQTGNWTFINEKREGGATDKWGWISEEVGSSIVLQLDTRSHDTTIDDNNNKNNNDGNNDVVLAYLRSYEHMGKFSVECTSGCSCDGMKLNGHWNEHKSVTEIEIFPVSQHAECEIRVKVLNASTRGEHKVKLLGLMVMEGGSFGGQGLQFEAILHDHLVPN